MGESRTGKGVHWTRLHMAMAITLSCLLLSTAGLAEEKKKLAVLPFLIHAPQPLDHLKQGLQEMVNSRIAGYGLVTISPETVNRHPASSAPTLQQKDILALARDLKADVIITGTLTQVGRKISLDLKVLDTAPGKPPFSVFVAEEDMDKLQEAVGKAAKALHTYFAGVVSIDSVHVKGNRRVEAEAILAVVESKKGESVDLERLDKDLRAVFAMGYFTDVKIDMEDTPKGKAVTFTVAEKPSIGRIVFQGNKNIKDDDLKKEMGIKLYAIMNPNDIRQSINKLKDHYYQKGYQQVEIKEKITDLPDNEVTLTYLIEEGEKAYITKIEFVGNTRFKAGTLKDLMETSERGLLSWFTGSGILDKKRLDFDLIKVTAFYHNHGYIRAKTGDPKISYEKGKGITITMEVIEGDQYAVRNVNIEGDLIKPLEELVEMAGIKKEKYFNREVVRKDTIAFGDLYADEGYAYAEVVPSTKEDDSTHVVDVTYRITKKTKARFERINILGNTQTRDKVIRRELNVTEGEYFSGKDLKKSTRNLNRLGYFEDVNIQSRKGTQEELMVLDINVKERPTGSFTVGAGYSSFDNVLGSVQISQSNLFGTGQKLSASASLGGRTSTFDIRFTEPWLMDRPVSAGVDLYKLKREHYEYTRDSTGGALALGFPLSYFIQSMDEYTRGSVKYGYDNADISDVREAAARVLRDMVGTSITSSMTFGVTRDSRDRIWNTTEGSLNSLSFEYAGGVLGGDIYFNRYEAKSAWYFPLKWDTVFMAQGKWGYVEQREGGKLPTYQKYRLGGINSVRGFDDYSISPTDPQSGDRIGGEKMMVYNLEYRFPLIKDQGIVGLVFFDAGNVYTEDGSYSFSGIKKSGGVGVRWYSPIGPLRLEYGRVIGPVGTEPSGNVEFSVGGLF